MPRRLLSAAAAGALLLGLAACGDGGEGTVTTPPPSINIDAPSDGGGDTEPSDGGGEETDEPTAAAPDIPPPDPAEYAGMDEQTPEGAEQAFRYYIAITYWGHQTGSIEIHESLYAEGCGTCSEFSSNINSISENGTYWSPFKISDYGIKTYDAENFDIEVGYIYTLEEHLEPEIDAESPAPRPAKTYTAAAGMNWVDGSWVVAGLNITETEIDLED